MPLSSGFCFASSIKNRCPKGMQCRRIGDGQVGGGHGRMIGDKFTYLIYGYVESGYVGVTCEDFWILADEVEVHMRQ